MTGRRTVLQGIAGLGIGAAAGRALAQDDPAGARPTPGDWLVPVRGENATTPLRPDDLDLAADPVQAYPMDPVSGIVRNGSLFNRVMLFRFAPEELTAAALENAADGVVAFTIICTHAACEATYWIPAEGVLECQCHFSRFNPRDNAAVLAGPATRHLPVLALTVADGRLTVARPFDGRLGGDADL